jgi:hypothetical protein
VESVEKKRGGEEMGRPGGRAGGERGRDGMGEAKEIKYSVPTPAHQPIRISFPSYFFSTPPVRVARGDAGVVVGF